MHTYLVTSFGTLLGGMHVLGTSDIAVGIDSPTRAQHIYQRVSYTHKDNT